MEITYGSGGWLLWHDSGLPGTTYLRFAQLGDYWCAHELYVDGDEPLDVRRLGKLPIRDLEALVNIDPTSLAEGARLPGPDLSMLASHFDTTFGGAAKHWVADSMRAQVSGAGVPQARRGHPKAPSATGRDRPPVTAPGSRIDDDHLKRVAWAYRDFVSRGLRPSPAIAREVGPGTSVRTVQRWIYQARKRRFLAPVKQGRTAG